MIKYRRNEKSSSASYIASYVFFDCLLKMMRIGREREKEEGVLLITAVVYGQKILDSDIGIFGSLLAF